MLTPKEYKEKADKIQAKYKEYIKKYDELEARNIEDNDEYIRLYEQLNEEYKDVYAGGRKINEETMVTKEFFNYFHPNFVIKLFCISLFPYYGKKLEDDSIFKGIVFSNNFYYYLTEDKDGLHYYEIEYSTNAEFESKLEKLVMNTSTHRYLVKYNDMWDDDFHPLQVFDTKEEAEAFVADKEHWKKEFKDEFGVDYNSLRESDFTDSMEDWLNEFVNKNYNIEEIRYFIDEI